jgi:hypothetical protein
MITWLTGLHPDFQELHIKAFYASWGFTSGKEVGV